MHDLIIIGAGPGGIALAAEAFASGIDQSQILILEKGPTHNSAIRQLYPEKKLTTANYKGFAARCEGLLCVRDMTKPETLQFFDKIISDYHVISNSTPRFTGCGDLKREVRDFESNHRKVFMKVRCSRVRSEYSAARISRKNIGCHQHLRSDFSLI